MLFGEKCSVHLWFLWLRSWELDILCFSSCQWYLSVHLKHTHTQIKTCNREEKTQCISALSREASIWLDIHTMNSPYGHIDAGMHLHQIVAFSLRIYFILNSGKKRVSRTTSTYSLRQSPFHSNTWDNIFIEAVSSFYAMLVLCVCVCISRAFLENKSQD